MSAVHDYDYATVRVVPCVPLEDFVTVGVVLHARTAGFLGARIRRDPDWLKERCPEMDADMLIRYLDAFEAVARGGPEGGPIALLPPSERFHWLTAPRSAVIQTSAVHTGRSTDPPGELDDLFRQRVR